jgi:immune inhibitor A
MALPVDASPAPITFADGSLLGNRRQPFDATFGTSITDAVTFHREIRKAGDVVVMRERVPAREQRTVFDDSDRTRYWSPANPWGSAKVAATGTRIRVLFESSGGRRMDLKVAFAD